MGRRIFQDTEREKAFFASRKEAVHMIPQQKTGGFPFVLSERRAVSYK